MPEGDTVLVTARRLHEALAGRRLLATDFRMPRYATTDLSGQSVREAIARGKHLLMRTRGDVTIHSHLRMDGEWQVHPPGGRWRGPSHEVRVVLRTEPWIAVGFRLGELEVLPTTGEPVALGHLGPDVLGSDWDPKEALRRLRADPTRSIHEALLDQRVMAGPGNVYANEVCFLRGVHPAAPVGAVRDLEAVVAITKRLMEANRASGRQVTTGDLRRGKERWVYGREGRSCFRCGTRVRREAASPVGRVRYWCSSCQPMPDDGPS